MTENSKQEISSFKLKVKKDAEELVLKGFPRRILDLNILSDSEVFSLNSRLKKFEINIPIPEPRSALIAKEGSGETKEPRKKDWAIDVDNELIITKPFLFPMGSVECNKQLVEMIDVLKPRMIALTEDILLLKLGLSLMVPKIEDGNNFGVEIQQETIEAIGAVESEVLNKFDKFETYFESRGDMIAKVAKYPHNQDFRVAVEESDQKFHLNLCLSLTDIRNHYVSLHDLVTKNLNKIKEPRSHDNKDFLS